MTLKTHSFGWTGLACAVSLMLTACGADDVTPQEELNLNRAQQGMGVAPTCFGQTATVYVEGGLMVGGSMDGLPYTGTLVVRDSLGTPGVPLVFVATDGEDNITVRDEAAVVCTLGGDDTVIIANADSVDTGDDADNVVISGSVDQLSLGAGDDFARGSISTLLVELGDGNDEVNFSMRAGGVIDGGDGDNKITAFRADMVISGDGNDRVTMREPMGGVQTGGGDDIVVLNTCPRALLDEMGDAVESDLVQTGAGNDTLRLIDCDARVLLGEGDDNMDALESRVWAFGEGGHDRLRVRDYDNPLRQYLDGGDGNDSIYVSALDAFVYGRAGDDAIGAAPVTGRIDGGTGDDAVSSQDSLSRDLAGPEVRFYGGAGNDFMWSPEVPEVATSRTEGFLMWGGPGDDEIIGGFLNDTLRGDFGADIVQGMGGDDTLHAGLDQRGDQIDGGDGDDTCLEIGTEDAALGCETDSRNLNSPQSTCRGQVANVYVSDGLIVGGEFDGFPYSSPFVIRDSIVAEGRPLVFAGVAGEDFIVARSEKAVICTFDGDDEVIIASADIVDTGDGDDEVLVSGSVDELYLGYGDDLARGRMDGEIVEGGFGDDDLRLVLPNGGDINAGEGNNSVLAIGASSFVSGTGQDSVTLRDHGGGANAGAGDDELRVQGCTRSLRFSAGEDLIVGGDGNDTVRVLDCDAEVLLGPGDDYLLLFRGDVLVNGNDGNDEIRIYETLIGSEVHGDAGDDQIFTVDGDIVVYGGEGNDELRINHVNGEVYGGEGNDTLGVGLRHPEVDYTLWGEGGDDYLYLQRGQTGSGTLMGGLGDDLLRGGDGDDFLDGGIGTDTLFGNDGDDTLVAGFDGASQSFDEGEDRLYAGDGADVCEQVDPALDQAFDCTVEMP